MSNTHSKVLQYVLKKIKPSNEATKKLQKLSQETLQLANKEAKKYNATAIIAGSLPRDTWLLEKNEFDIFVIFPKSISGKQLEELGLKIGKSVITKLGGKWIIEYAQHPYIHGTVKGIEIDVVPCYAIQPGEKIISAVDRTPLHMEYLNKNLPRNSTDDVRLLKQLLKTNGIYGADTKTEGLSGYLCELLVIKYGNFINILKATSQWKPHYIIDIQNYWSKEEYKHLKNKFKKEIFIVIDPVDKERNVASPVSPSAFYKFKKSANEFLRKPNENFFTQKIPKPLSTKEFDKTMKSRITNLIAVTFKPPKVVPDILWPQLRKTNKRLESILKEYEFVTLRSESWTDEKNLAVILLEMQVACLPEIDKVTGPWVFDEKNAVSFAKKHKHDAITGPFIDENFWVVETKRKWVMAKEKLIGTLNGKEKILVAKGIPNYIASHISKGFKILEQKEIRAMLKNKSFAQFLRSYFEKENLVSG